MPESNRFCQQLAATALRGEQINRDQALRVLTDPELPLLPLLDAALQVRRHHFGLGVRVHILNNVQNGLCPEDCNYCAQSTSSSGAVPVYRMKSDETILEEARRAYDSGAYRYCLVLSGRGPGEERMEHLAALVQRLKATLPMEVCLSAGFIDSGQAARLKQAGLDRYNHNLNTSESRYGTICHTHTYADRVATLDAARSVGLEVCSGLIIGMGEGPEEIVEVALTLNRLDARSIPVNFYVHAPGAALGEQRRLTPEACLRALCLFRFLNPSAEVRAAGGREVNLRSLEALALYPANSLFAEGYLNTGGHGADKTIQMIQDAGFTVERIDEHE
ncbi:MAG: biotin synthase BioB [Magnetococcales bacterium]|nr:biotin synthase BioB [Magnetococcales bacterium]